MKKAIYMGIGGLGTAAVLLGGMTFAKTSLGTVTTPKGDTLQKVSIQGEITNVTAEGRREVTVKEADGSEYKVFMGPRWKTETDVKVGDKVTVEGVEKDGSIRTWKLIKADGSEVVLRTEAGKPSWAGKGQGKGEGRGMHRGQGFVDANGDGVCDNSQK